MLKNLCPTGRRLVLLIAASIPLVLALILIGRIVYKDYVFVGPPYLDAHGTRHHLP